MPLERMSECPFCRIGAGEEDRDLVAYRTSTLYVITVPWQRPRNPGHSLVIPRTHVTSLGESAPHLLHELFEVVGRVASAVEKAFGASGSTILQNTGTPGQGLDHLHVHVIPRFEGDGFMLPDPVRPEVPFEVRRRQAVALGSVLTGA